MVSHNWLTLYLRCHTGDDNLVSAQSFGNHYIEQTDRTGASDQTGLANSDLRSLARVDGNCQRLDHSSFFVGYMVG